MYLENSKRNSDGPPNNLQCSAIFFFFLFPSFQRLMWRDRWIFYSPTLSLYRSLARFFLEREKILRRLMWKGSIFLVLMFFLNLIFNPFFILKYTLLLSDGLTLAKQMGTAERLSNVEGGNVKFLKMLK